MRATIYQIYPRSFADSNGDGVGDLRGILGKVDYLADLGVGAVWLSPIYASPHEDNGYDISDYYAIDPVFGTLEDFDELLAALHERGIRLIMDLVVNHTSDEHPWFRESRGNRTNPWRDWYWWRPGRTAPDGRRLPPNGWGSFFSGSAWTLDPASDEYYLHLFSPKQPDLNWENPQVRAAIYAMMNWWVDRGVDGFRMDVINYISKTPDLPPGRPDPDGFEDGSPWFADGPRLVEYLQEMRSAVLEGRQAELLTVGETPGISPTRAAALTDRRSGPLDMVFQFEHVNVDQVGTDKWELRPASARDAFASLVEWQQALGDHGWNSLYLSNHDQPRQVSRFGDDGPYRVRSATAIATALHLLRGTPYVFQGEELGMANAPIQSPDDLHDIESRNYFATAVAQGRDANEVLDVLRRKGRDNPRSPMQWTSGPNAGFSTGEPWMPVNPDHRVVNAADEAERDDSVLAHYRRLIRFRASSDVVVRGDFGAVDSGDPNVLAYERTLGDQKLLVVVNLSGEARACRLLADAESMRLVLTNHRRQEGGGVLAPWEALVYQSGGVTPSWGSSSGS
jgi:oligo-1,6-glucosidase